LATVAKRKYDIIFIADGIAGASASLIIYHIAVFRLKYSQIRVMKLICAARR